jgi:hypothetical protein
MQQVKNSKLYIFFYKVFVALRYEYLKIVTLFKWILGLFSLFRIKGKNRLLFIYDLTYQPFSIGDFLVANGASLALSEIENIKQVDILIIFDKNNITKTKEFSHINTDNIYFNISSLLPIAQINQHFSSLLIFDNRFQADKYILDNIQNYKVYPNMKLYGMGTYYYWDAMNSIFPTYYDKFGHPPYFICRNYLTSWVNQFFLKHAEGKIVVTINLRNNKNHGQNRNSKLDEWYKFFNYCNDRFNVKFIVICSINEVDERWRQCSNVLVAKDFHTFIEHDLALINNSHFHMGSPSGPFSMAWFGTKPYIMFNFESNHLKLYKSIIEKDGYLRFSFANPLQLMTLKEEFFDNILFEFLHLYNNIEQDKIFVNNEVNDEGLAFLR